MAAEPSRPVVWILGASGALGAAIAQRLAEDGATVIESSRSAALGPVTGSDRRWGYPLDLRDDATVRAASAAIVAQHGRIDGLVATANVAGFGDFLELEDDQWQAIVDTKLMGTVRALRAVLPGMCAQGGGAAVVVTGRGGIAPPANHFPGATMNAALDLLVQGLGRRFGPQGVRVNSVAPGPVLSRRFDQMAAKGAGDAATALAGPCRPEDVADAVAFLLGEKARFINGTRLAVDGGGPRYA